MFVWRCGIRVKRIIRLKDRSEILVNIVSPKNTGQLKKYNHSSKKSALASKERQFITDKGWTCSWMTLDDRFAFLSEILWCEFEGWLTGTRFWRASVVDCWRKPAGHSHIKKLKRPAVCFCTPCELSCPAPLEALQECPVISETELLVRFAPIGVVLFLLGFVVGLRWGEWREREQWSWFCEAWNGEAAGRWGLVIESWCLKRTMMWHGRLLVRTLTERSWVIVTPDPGRRIGGPRLTFLQVVVGFTASPRFLTRMLCGCGSHEWWVCRTLGNMKLDVLPWNKGWFLCLEVRRLVSRSSWQETSVVRRGTWEVETFPFDLEEYEGLTSGGLPVREWASSY